MSQRPNTVEEQRVRDRAYAKVRTALRTGELVRPSGCEDCPPLHAHHHIGYDHPLDVVWLCAAHHGNAHREEGWALRVLKGEESA